MQLKGFMFNMILHELEDVVGRDNTSVLTSDKISHGVDYFWVPRMWADRGQELPKPDVVVRPGSTEEVSRVMVIANYYKMPVQVWGGGSGSQGGALPMAGGILLDMKRMNKVICLNEESMTITMEAGINFQQLEWFANEKGYSLMHYPSSINCATVGGFLAHRGTGILSTKYGNVDDLCLNVEVVLADGDVVNSLSVPKHASGPDMTKIFIGSEGTLGIITKATFKIFLFPEERRFRAFLFKDINTGIAACRDIMKKLKPSIMRLYDEAETRSIIKDVIGVDVKGAFMNLAVEGIKDVVDIEERIILEICSSYEADDLGSEYGEKWYKNRIKFFYPDHIMDIPQMFGTMDTVATYSNIEKVYWAMKEAIESNFEDEGVRFIAHFSHWYEWGAMMYDRFIIDNPPEDPEEAIRLHNKIWDIGIRAALANGGVLNHHHGVGLKISRLMKEQYGSGMRVFEGLKKTLDPNGILNPYKLGL